MNDDVIADDARTDGMFPLITNDEALSIKQVLHAADEDLPIGSRAELERAADAEFGRCFREWVGRQLPRQVRQVALMRLQRLTYREIAAVMGITSQGARVYFVRGIEKLRRTRSRPA